MKGSLAMAKGFRNILVIIFLLTMSLQINAQYEPSGSYQPKSVARRLSYENFRNIRMLTTAIMNYGGGKAEFNRLVDSYSEASSLYFSNELEKSVKVYRKNELDIRKTAMAIARKYKQDVDRLHKELIKFDVKKRIQLQLTKEKVFMPAQKILGQSSSSKIKANDLFERTLPIKSIYSFRRAKEDILFYYKIMLERSKTDEEKKQLQSILDSHKKDMVDNKNKVYVSKQKQN